MGKIKTKKPQLQGLQFLCQGKYEYVFYCYFSAK